MAAHIPLKAAAAFPVLAVVTIFAFFSCAFTTATTEARSLKDAVGNLPSPLR